MLQSWVISGLFFVVTCIFSAVLQHAVKWKDRGLLLGGCQGSTESRFPFFVSLPYSRQTGVYHISCLALLKCEAICE